MIEHDGYNRMVLKIVRRNLCQRRAPKIPWIMLYRTVDSASALLLYRARKPRYESPEIIIVVRKSYATIVRVTFIPPRTDRG